jgi:D-psicose/D-tagatose/L-ribulose 3-epimerase
MEFHRSVETLLLLADLFVQHKINAAIEPIRSAEVSIVHTVADAKSYIQAVNHPGVRHINGGVYHMQAEEPSMGKGRVCVKLVSLCHTFLFKAALPEKDLLPFSPY